MVPRWYLSALAPMSRLLAAARSAFVPGHLARALLLAVLVLLPPALPCAWGRHRVR